MLQPEPSVSDSISYLQHFLNTSDTAPPSTAAREASQRLANLAQPPTSLPASFLDGSRRSQPTAALHRSPPSTITVLSRRSSAQPSVIDDAAPSSSLFGPPPRHNSTNNTSAVNKGTFDFRDRSRVNLFDSFASRNRSFAAPSETANMFRYGSNRNSRPDDGWRGSGSAAAAASPSPLHAFPHNEGSWPAGSRGVEQAPASPAWGPPSQTQQQYPRHSTPSSALLYHRASAGAEERFPWRRNSAAAPTHHGSSLLWGWGNEGPGNTGTSYSSSPPPLQTSPFYRDGGGGPSPSGSYPGRRSRESAYEEVVEERQPWPAGQPSNVAAPRQNQYQPQQTQPRLRRPPVAPPPPPPPPPTTNPAPSRGGGRVELTTCHNADEHAANMRRIAHYLKDYYAREADEMERGVESLTAEDVAGLAQCFYVDLYRTVRQARQAAGMETSSFVAEDPAENVIASVAPPPPPPPPPPQREDNCHAASSRSAKESAATTATPPRAAPEQRRGGGRKNDDVVSSHSEEDEEGSFVQGSGRRLNSPTPPLRARSAQASPQHLSVPAGEQARPRSGSSFSPSATSSPHREGSTADPPSHTFSHGGDTPAPPGATFTRRAPNQELAYSGGGTHPVQIITARVPAFRNDDAVSNSRSGDVSMASSCSPSASARRSGAHQLSPSFSFPRGGGHADSAVVEAASLSALAGTPSPPYRHLSPTPQPHQSLLPRQQSALTSPWSATLPHAAARPPARGPRTNTPSESILQPSSQLLSSAPQHSSAHRHRRSRSRGQRVQVQAHFDDASTDGSSSNDDNDDESFTAEGSEAEMTNHRTAAAEPSSGIVKRPLKELMPLLRTRGTLIVKHIHQDRRPHLRVFQILDCIDVFRGSEVLMPHFTWAAAEKAYRHDRPPRPKAARKGVPLPTGLSLSQHDIPYETALNLTTLEAVYVGAGRGISEQYLPLFHRRTRDGAILDHRRRPVANGMCAVFVFASRPVAVTFLREDDRQLWVGAMMGVVERNRTLAT